MNITPELLRALGFEQEKNRNDILIDTWRLKLGGCLFTIKGSGPTFHYYSPGSYEPHYHMVTDLEELLVFTHKDAYDLGVEGCKQELREFLGVKHGD